MKEKSKGKIIIPGGSGFLGRHLAKQLSDESYEVVVLSRRFSTRMEPYRSVFWDGATKGPWCAELEGALAVINLSGRTVDCRYHAKNRREILESRLLSTRILSHAIKDAKVAPGIFINAASATIYADTRGDAPANDEVDGKIGEGFSVMVCREWEAEFNRWTFERTKKVCLRIAITLGEGGGVMTPLRRLARLGLGGHQGPGEQFVSWLHVDDFCGIVQNIIEGRLQGSLYNCASPHSMKNRDFMREIRLSAGGLGRFMGIPMPGWLLAIGAVLIRTETELVLKSRHVMPKRLLEEGYEFRRPELEGALSWSRGVGQESELERLHPAV
ncbi:MAG: TIGR01777 family oxidoreductase, partial [Opitutales bacterium]